METPRTPKRTRQYGVDPGSFTPSQRVKETVPPLSNYALGDCLGRGAYATVYRALNLATGETVAVKQFNLSDVAKSDTDTIMMEIDLLKNLNHPNIVKYHGFVKSTDTLNIILEYCENGSLSNICKKFGKFPENLVAVYVYQVLQGLAFLHQQGTIHRDIKGANILTTKDGRVKLADFGVATSIGKNADGNSVAGTPNWMAPEIIELNGATTASDIWSVGCTILELLTGKPPYHNLRQMPALFAIVNDDHPPIPEGLSHQVKDFLLQCFQKDPNLRVSARKLLKHPWMVAVANSESTKKFITPQFDDAVKTVQMWNDAIQRPGNSTKNKKEEKSQQQQQQQHSQPPQSQLAKPISTPPRPSRVVRERASPKSTGTSPQLKKTHLRPSDLEKYSEEVEDEEFSSSEFVQNSNDDPFKSVRKFSDTKRDQFRRMVAKSAASNESLGSWDKEGADELTDKLGELTIDNGAPQKVTERGEPKDQAAPPSHARINFVKSSAPPKPNLLGKDSPYRESEMDDYSDLEGALNFSRLKSVANQSSLSFPPVIRPSDLFSRSSTSSSTATTTSSSSTTASKPRESRSREEIDWQNDTATLDSKPQPKNFHPNLEAFAEEEENDYTGAFGGVQSGAAIPSTIPSQAMKDQQEESEDEFEIMPDEEDEDYDLSANAARDRLARAHSQIESIIEALNETLGYQDLLQSCERLLALLNDFPETKKTIVRAHGVLPMLEILDHQNERAIVLCLLRIVNCILIDDVHLLENFSMIGGIPTITKFVSKKFPDDVRLEAARFVQLMCDGNRLSLQMLISCGGLHFFSEFIEEDFIVNQELVIIGICGLWNVFEVSSAPRNDICRIMARSSTLDSLIQVLLYVARQKHENHEQLISKIISIFFTFSQTESRVKETIGSRVLFRGVFKCYSRLSEAHQIMVLKFIKNLSSVPSNFTTLQNSNAIESLVDILTSSKEATRYKDIASQILHIMFNLCRLSKPRQEEAAICGIVPVLQEVVEKDMPFKQFALPILFDMAHAGKTCRKILWQHNGLATYLDLTTDPYWQVNAYEAISAWLGDETARVEDFLSSCSEKLLDGIDEAKNNNLQAVLESMHKIIRTSTRICTSIPLPRLLVQIKKRMRNSNVINQLNSLRIARTALESRPSMSYLLRETHLLDTLRALTSNDSPILVRELAKELINLAEPTTPVSSSNRTSLVRAGSKKVPRRNSTVAQTPVVQFGDYMTRPSISSTPTSPSFKRPQIKKRIIAASDHPETTALAPPKIRGGHVQRRSVDRK
ncbi:hypothetical protein TRVA0_009S01134 [Trichomonascus vanleenenianus]|uniref:uncharacterized protein n=1 Tax=Trichomonascus vanleenenianus TaxID=2268995 RepID=UPI003ECA2D34